MEKATQSAFCDELEKIAFPGQLWDQMKDWFRPEAQKAKKHVAEHYESENPRKWNLFLARAANSPEFLKQLKRSGKSSDKDVLHAVSMAALQKSPTVSQVDSQSEPGVTYQIRKLPGGAFACTCNDWRYQGSTNPGYECKHIRAHRGGLNKVANFKDMSLAFFDELQKIRDAHHIDAEKGMRDNYADNGSPFSNMLTQDEEPTTYNPQPAQAIDEPEVIIGGNG